MYLNSGSCSDMNVVRTFAKLDQIGRVRLRIKVLWLSFAMLRGDTHM